MELAFRRVKHWSEELGSRACVLVVVGGCVVECLRKDLVCFRNLKLGPDLCV